MKFDLNHFRAIASEIEKKHYSFFERAKEHNMAVSIHNFYYIYFKPQNHYLRFTANSGLPDFIKEEIEEAYRNFNSGSLS